MSCTILQCHLFQINTNVHTSWIPWIYFLKNYPYQTSYCSFKLSQFILDKIFKNLLETHMPYHVAMLKKNELFHMMPNEEAKDFPHIELLDLWIHVTSIEKSIGVIYYLFYVVHWLTDRCAKTYHLLLKKHTKIKISTIPERFCTNQ